MAKKAKGKTLAEIFSGLESTPGTAAWFDMIFEWYGEMFKMDGYDDCIMGVSHQFSKTTILYDKDKVIAKLAKEMLEPYRKGGPSLVERKDQASDDALEWFEFNMIGAWMGEGTPSFFTRA